MEQPAWLMEAFDIIDDTIEKHRREVAEEQARRAASV